MENKKFAVKQTRYFIGPYSETSLVRNAEDEPMFFDKRSSANEFAADLSLGPCQLVYGELRRPRFSVIVYHPSQTNPK